MLRVAIETQFALGTPTGLGVYATRLAAALRDAGGIDVVELRDPSFDLWRFDRRVLWDQVRAPKLVRAAAADVAHFTGGTLPLRAPHPVVLTVHDLVWLRRANRGRAYVHWYYGVLQPRLARKADAIVVDTQCARADVADGMGIDPGRISVAGAGVDPAFFALARVPDESNPFVLSVGTVEERKDLATAVRALARVPGTRLVSVGPLTPYARDVMRLAAALGVSGRISLRGYVDDASLLDLYARAAALIFPSRYEGFGLPPLQALACGLPVVASRIPVIEEVLGDAAAYATPGDAAEFAAALQTAMQTRDVAGAERGRQRAREHSWARVAERLRAVYAGLAR